MAADWTDADCYAATRGMGALPALDGVGLGLAHFLPADRFRLLVLPSDVRRDVGFEPRAAMEWLGQTTGEDGREDPWGPWRQGIPDGVAAFRSPNERGSAWEVGAAVHWNGGFEAIFAPHVWRANERNLVARDILVQQAERAETAVLRLRDWLGTEGPVHVSMSLEAANEVVGVGSGTNAALMYYGRRRALSAGRTAWSWVSDDATDVAVSAKLRLLGALDSIRF